MKQFLQSFISLLIGICIVFVLFGIFKPLSAISSPRLVQATFDREQLLASTPLTSSETLRTRGTSGWADQPCGGIGHLCLC